MALKFSLIPLQKQLENQGFHEHRCGSIDEVLSQIKNADFYKRCNEFYIVEASKVGGPFNPKSSTPDEPQFVLYYRR